MRESEHSLGRLSERRNGLLGIWNELDLKRLCATLISIGAGNGTLVDGSLIRPGITKVSSEDLAFDLRSLSEDRESKEAELLESRIVIFLGMLLSIECAVTCAIV